MGFAQILPDCCGISVTLPVSCAPSSKIDHKPGAPELGPAIDMPNGAQIALRKTNCTRPSALYMHDHPLRRSRAMEPPRG